MGIDRHNLTFLKYASGIQPLGEVATMGRQGLSLSPVELRSLLGPDAAWAEFCEPMLVNNLGAKLVESFDYSDFEGATHIIDLNKPQEPDRQYDTIIDAGTSEHIFNAPEALKTYAKMCRTGGQILHMLPANNFCNHGFWQISPELFFSLYSEQNGFADTEVYLADVTEKSHWWKVTPPNHGHWSDATTPRSMTVLARTRKVKAVTDFSVQQGGYVSSWSQEPCSPVAQSHGRLKRFLESSPAFPVLRYARRVTKPADWAFKRNPDFERVLVDGMVLRA